MRLVKSLKKNPIWSKFSGGQWAILIVGIVTLFFFSINLFTSLGSNRPPAPVLYGDVSLANPQQFEKILASAVNSTVESGSPVKILTNGQEFLPDLLLEIQNATQSIYITNYIWDGGEFGNTIFRALIEKAKTGVRVYVLLDGISGRKANDKYIKKLTDLGGKVAYFRPVRWWNVYRINGRTHVREFVIDNKIAYIGGIAISDGWLGNATSTDSWHDFMFKTSGVMAERSNSVFSNMWSQTTGEILSVQDSVVEPDKNQGNFISLFSAPSPDMSGNMEHFIWLSIKAAQTSIYIQNPYLLPDKSILEALESKAKAGVNVEIIVPGRHIDSPHTRWASQSFYRSLLKAGVKIYEYQPSRIHTKTMVIDGVWSIIGSANLDNRSSQINLESIMGINDPQLGADLEAKFIEDLGKSREITAEEWSRSSLFMVPIQRFARLFIHQF